MLRSHIIRLTWPPAHHFDIIVMDGPASCLLRSLLRSLLQSLLLSLPWSLLQFLLQSLLWC